MIYNTSIESELKASKFRFEYLISKNKVIDVDLLNETSAETFSYPYSLWDIETCEANGKIFFFGGHNGSDLDHIYELNPSTNTFTLVANMIIPGNAISTVYSSDGWIYYWRAPDGGDIIQRFNPITYQVEQMNSVLPSFSG